MGKKCVWAHRKSQIWGLEVIWEGFKQVVCGA